MTIGQRNALIIALLLTCTIAVIHTYVRYADQPASMLIGQTIGWVLVPWIVTGAVAGTMAVWWKMRRKQGPVIGVMIWAIFVLLAAQTTASFTVVASLPN